MCTIIEYKALLSQFTIIAIAHVCTCMKLPEVNVMWLYGYEALAPQFIYWLHVHTYVTEREVKDAEEVHFSALAGRRQLWRNASFCRGN